MYIYYIWNALHIFNFWRNFEEFSFIEGSYVAFLYCDLIIKKLFMNFRNLIYSGKLISREDV